LFKLFDPNIKLVYHWLNISDSLSGVVVLDISFICSIVIISESEVPEGLINLSVGGDF